MRVRRKACVVSSCLWQRSTSNCSWIGPQNRSVSVNYLSCGCEAQPTKHPSTRQCEVIRCQWWTLLAADGAEGRKKRAGRTHAIYSHVPSYSWSCEVYSWMPHAVCTACSNSPLSVVRRAGSRQVRPSGWLNRGRVSDGIWLRHCPLVWTLVDCRCANTDAAVVLRLGLGRAKGDDISRSITKHAARAAVSEGSFVCRFFGSESPQPFKGAVDSCPPCLTLCCHQIGASLAQRQARGLEALPLWLSVRLLWAYWPATMRLMWAAYRRCVRAVWRAAAVLMFIAC